MSFQRRLYIGSESDQSDNEDDQCGIHSYDTTTRLLMVFLMLWGHLFHLSNAALNIFVLFIQHFLTLIVPNKSTQSDNHNTEQQRVLPKSLRSIHKALGLNSDDFI